MTKIVVSGAEGRMGRRIIELARKDPEFEVVGGLEVKANPGLSISGSLNDIRADYSCIIEFTSPAATLEHLKHAENSGKGMVIGTTGFSEKEFNAIKKASGSIPVVFSPNMSVCVNLFFGLIRKSAEILGGDYRVRIKETHHTHKKDKPSGTARVMADIIKEISGKDNAVIESAREGEVIGEHEIIFESASDTLRISHNAKTRDIFALGALKAAGFIAKKKKGLFSMSDVLGLKAKG